jgi:hypothetical protein
VCQFAAVSVKFCTQPQGQKTFRVLSAFCLRHVFFLTATIIRTMFECDATPCSLVHGTQISERLPLPVLQISPVSIIPPVLCSHSFTYHCHRTISQTDSTGTQTDKLPETCSFQTHACSFITTYKHFLSQCIRQSNLIHSSINCMCWQRSTHRLFSNSSAFNATRTGGGKERRVCISKASSHLTNSQTMTERMSPL